MPRSPFKEKLAKATSKLKLLKKRNREVIATGRQSVVLTEEDNYVLLVTRYLVAKKNLELLRKLDPLTCPFVCPKIVALNANLAELINPVDPAIARKVTKKIYTVLFSEIWHDNVVYQLPRYTGTLEDLQRFDYDEKSIDQLNRTLTESLTYLHQHGLTHNDISLKNIFYSGKHPHLQFHLGDFGSVTENTGYNHEMQCAKDFLRLKLVLAQAQKTLEQKRKSSTKKDEFNKMLHTYGKCRKRKRQNQEIQDETDLTLKHVAKKHRLSKC